MGWVYSNELECTALSLCYNRPLCSYDLFAQNKPIFQNEKKTYKGVELKNLFRLKSFPNRGVKHCTH